jgi:uncharacterized membrane protein YbjE (DUF340 family)
VLILFSYLLIGGIIGWWRLLPKKILEHAGRGMTLGVMLLLLTMGLRLGADEKTLSQLGVYGLQAFVFAALSIIGSTGTVYLLERIFIKRSILSEEQDSFNVNMENAHPYRMTGIILGAFAIGALSGIFLIPEGGIDYLPKLMELALDFTLVMVGIDLGLNREIWQHLYKMGWQVFLAPIGVAVGSVLAGMLVGLFFGWSIREGGAVGAGFGWYSLSGILISDLHSVALGTIAFLTNVFREILSILLAPFLARRVSALVLVSPGGATTMDSTLSLLVAVGPKGVGVVAFISGFTLSTLVPILVPLFLGKF